MLLSLQQLIDKYSLKINGVIHIGAHFGEEVPDYIKHGIKDIVLIEPCKQAYQKLFNRFGPHHHIKLYNIACGTTDGVGTMHTETRNQGQSNSLLKPAKHLDFYPDIIFNGAEEVRIQRLDSLQLGTKYNMINIDVQGSEGHVFLGAKKTLEHIDYIYSEINEAGANLYEGAIDVNELDAILNDFQRVETYWTGQGWGDALYVRKK